MEPPVIHFRSNEIVPRTERTAKLKAKQEAEKNLQLQERERAMKAKKDQELKNQKMKAERDKQRELDDRKRKEDDLKKEEEKQQMNTLKGKFGSMVNQLNADYTPLEYTISGMLLKPAQIRILVKAAEQNKTLRILSMSRKNLTDDDGVEIAACLNKNSVLEKIELEGNNLGPRCLHEFAKMLKSNKTLRSLDFEGNNLTQTGKDVKGVLAIAEILKKNTTLLALNLGNCNLDNACSAGLAEALEYNKTLIMLELQGNPNMFYKDVLRIQESLKRNKAEYDQERFKEFVERKYAKMEEDNNVQLNQEDEEGKMATDLIHQRVDDMEMKRMKSFQEKIDREEEEKRKMIEKLEKEAKIRAGGKKKRGGKKKKKK